MCAAGHGHRLLQVILGCKKPISVRYQKMVASDRWINGTLFIFFRNSPIHPLTPLCGLTIKPTRSLLWSLLGVCVPSVNGYVEAVYFPLTATLKIGTSSSIF